jgi:hypothetical protein
MLAMMLSKRFDRGAMLMLSHAGDYATEVTWQRCDIDAESC